MTFKPTVGKPMKTVAHNQQLKTSPSRLRGLKAVGIIDLAAELADDPLNDVGSAWHSRMIKVGKEEIHLVLKREDLPLQPTVLESLSLLLPDLKPEVELLFGGDVKELRGQVHEALDSSTRSLVEVAEVVVEKLFHVAHAELQGDTREQFLASTPKPSIPINDKPFEGVGEFACEALKQGLPVLRGFDGCQTGQGEILSNGIGAEEQ